MSQQHLVFDALAAAVLAGTALLGACAPLYLVERGYSSTCSGGGDPGGGGGGGGRGEDERMGGKGGQGRGKSMAFVIGNMFSAGVMVSAGLCHLLGEALRELPTTKFPWATFLCGCGLLVTLCADQAATKLHTQYSSASAATSVLVCGGGGVSHGGWEKGGRRE